MNSYEFTALLARDRQAALRAYFKAWLDASASEEDTIEALVLMAASSDIPLVMRGEDKDICQQFDQLVGNKPEFEAEAESE
jgi:hypothetical protein